MWGWTFGEQLRQDVRYALRAMVKNRAFTTLAVLSLALGIGANTAIFSFMDALLLRSLPVSDPGSLAVVNWRAKAYAQLGPGRRARVASVVHSSIGRNGETFSYPAFEFLGKDRDVFSALFGYFGSGQLNVKVRGEADLGEGEGVSGDYFRGLGVPPAAGRLITSDD